MLTNDQKSKYEKFYDSTHSNEHLDSKTEVLIGLSSSIALNCKACTHYYLKQAKKENITKGEISELIAKVMAVSAGQKRLQTQEVLRDYKIDLDTYK